MLFLMFLFLLLPYIIAAAGAIISLIFLISFLSKPKGSKERDEEKHSFFVMLIVFVVLTAASFGLSFLVSRGIISMM